MRVWIFLSLLIIAVFLSNSNNGEAVSTDWERVLHAGIAEAANQGEEGLYAVYCVMRNRGWGLGGFSGARREDLMQFINRQPSGVYATAAAALERVRTGGADTTYGATHFENVEQFGLPWWAESMRQTAKIGQHTFWAEAQ